MSRAEQACQSPNSAGGSYRFDPYNLNFVVTTHTTEIDACCAPIREVPGPLIVGYLPHDRDTKDSRVEEIIDLLEIEEWRKYPVALLPYGIQKRIELGRALAMDPELLLLDEPVAGMNLEETEDMARFILDIREELGISILLVEHDMGLVMDIADRVVVLDFGRKIAEGIPSEIQANPDVIKAYLGEEV